MSTKQLDEGLRMYYKHLNAEYDNNGIGKMIEWCEDNGYDTDMIKDELSNDPNDCYIVDFDELFPTNKSGDQRKVEIFKVISHCWENKQAFVDSATIPKKKLPKTQQEVSYRKTFQESTVDFLCKFGWTQQQVFNAFNAIYNNVLTISDYEGRYLYNKECVPFKCTQEHMDKIVEFLMNKYPKPSICNNIERTFCDPPCVEYDEILSTPMVLMKSSDIVSLLHGYLRTKTKIKLIDNISVDIILLCHQFCVGEKHSLIEDVANVKMDDSKEHFLDSLILHNSLKVNNALNLTVFNNVEIHSKQFLQSENDIKLNVGGDLILKPTAQIKSNSGNIFLNVEGNIVLFNGLPSTNITTDNEGHIYMKCSNFITTKEPDNPGSRSVINTAPETKEINLTTDKKNKLKNHPKTAFGNIYIKIKDNADLTSVVISSGDVDIECDGTITHMRNDDSCVALRNNTKIKTNELAILESYFIDDISASNKVQVTFNKLKIHKEFGRIPKYINP